jgi:hypothetical protein
VAQLLSMWEFVGDPHRRSWPYPPTRLERKARELGVDDEALRAWLYEQVARGRTQTVRKASADAGSSRTSTLAQVPRGIA